MSANGAGSERDETERETFSNNLDDCLQSFGVNVGTCLQSLIQKSRVFRISEWKIFSADFKVFFR